MATVNTTPYLIFEQMIANVLIDNGSYDEDWFSSDLIKARMSMYWNHGETPASAAETMLHFANAAKTKSIGPTDKRICLGVDYF